MSQPGKKIIVIEGPTAVGKTAVAIDLALRLGTEIISADSRQCYKGMSIGTAKPTPDELKLVKHHFIDEFPVTTQLDAHDFEQLALGCLEHIFLTNDHAVVCGGTGLYIKALCEGIDDMPAVDPSINDEVNEAYNSKGLIWLQETVQQEDPLFYAQGEIQNPARLLRALIFIRSAGESIIKYRTNARKDRPFGIIKIGLELQREELYKRINERVDNMLARGLADEVATLYPYRHLKNLRTVGYEELFGYMDGECTMKEAVTKIKQHTRNYAKRQLTWFKKDTGTTWFRADVRQLIDKILSFLA